MVPKHENNGRSIIVVGAGVFGCWIALLARRAGYRVTLVEQWGPANARASSTGESRIIRSAYGPDRIYTVMAQQSLQMWHELFAAEKRSCCFRQSGVLWIASDSEPALWESQQTFDQLAIPYQLLTRERLAHRFPQFRLPPHSLALFEPGAGALLAEKSIETVFEAARREGVHYQQATVLPPKVIAGSIACIETSTGEKLHADAYIFSTGSWLSKLFPEYLGRVIRPTRQVLFFFNIPAQSSEFAPETLPCWVDQSHPQIGYGVPDLGSGLKLGFHSLGTSFDPDSGERSVDATFVSEAAEYAASRFPSLGSPELRSTIVCHYENTPGSDFLIDRHPSSENIWFCGGGSGHGFKHAPAIARYLLQQLGGDTQREARFSLNANMKTTAARVL